MTLQMNTNSVDETNNKIRGMFFSFSLPETMLTIIQKDHFVLEKKK